MKTDFTPRPGRLMDQVRETLRFYHYSQSTEKSYVHWILRYIRFNDRRHPKDMGKAEIERFLSHLAINRNVSIATQNLALNAILFLYKSVLKLPIEADIRANRASKRKRMPTVLSREEIKAICGHLAGSQLLMVQLMYGAGLRVLEVHRLRVQDFDFDNEQLYIRSSKGNKDRTSLFPRMLHTAMREQLEKVKRMHEMDLEKGFGEVSLPDALSRKYPKAGKSLGWQYAFPATTLAPNPRDGLIQRYHVHPTSIRKSIRKAVSKTHITKRVTTHVFRHSFATHMLEDGVNIRPVRNQYVIQI